MRSIHESPLRRAQANFYALVFLEICSFFVLSPIPGKAASSDLPSGTSRASTPSLREIAPGIFELGTLRLDKKKRSVVFPAIVNQTEGILEYLVVSTGGKVHESVFSTEIEPYQLHVAMLLLGAQGGSAEKSAELSTPLKGDPLYISVQWESNGKPENHPGEELLFDQQNNQTMQDPGWIYSGSFFLNGKFAAQTEKSIIAIIEDPLALINTPRPRKGNYGNWLPHKTMLPPLGTPVQVTIQFAPLNKDF